MGKKSDPIAPTPPDPVAVANAQAGANKEAAIATANLNRIDQTTPQGAISYQQTGTNSDGTPHYLASQSYSPAEQAKYDQQNQVALALGSLAGSNINRVFDAQAQPFSYAGMTPLASHLQSYPLYSSPDTPGVQRSVASTPVQTGFNAGPGVQTSFNAGPALQYGRAYGAGPVANSVPTGPLQTSIPGAGQGLQTNVQAQTALQTALAPAGPIGQLSGAGTGVQNSINTNNVPGMYGGNVQQNVNFGGAPALPGTQNFSADGQRVADSVYQQATSRLDPQFQQQQNDLQARLANSGISNNSDAYRREMDNFGRTQNDAYNQANFSAVQAGGAEQSRLFNLALGARQQSVNETQAAGQFHNAADQQNFGYASQNNSQAFQQAQALQQSVNAAQQQWYAQHAQQVSQNNASQQQGFDQSLNSAQFGNQAQGQQFGQNLSNANLNNAAQQQGFDQYLGAGQFANQAQGQEFGQNLSNANLNNAAQNQVFTQGTSDADLYNRTSGQQYTQNLGQAQFGNQASQQVFGDNAAQAAFYNQAQDQQFGQNLSQADLYNSAGNTAFGQAQSAGAFNNQMMGQMFNQDVVNANLQNTSREQEINEATYLRNLPMNEIAALMSGTSINNPNFANVAQAGVAAPDYQGAVYANYNGANQQYQAQEQARSQMLGAIFGGISSAGSAAIMASDRRVKENIVRVGTLASGLPTYAFNYIGSKARQFGVMAQDVLRVIPSAVIVRDGVLHVDYSKVYQHA